MSIQIHSRDKYNDLCQTAVLIPSQLSSRAAYHEKRRAENTLLRNANKTHAMHKIFETAESRKKEEIKVIIDQDTEIANKIAHTAKRKEAKRDAHYRRLWHQVEVGNALAKELGAQLQLNELAKKRQYQQMFEEWNTGVFHKLNDKIVESVSKLDSQQLNFEKNETYQKFLDASNRRGGLLRDYEDRNEEETWQAAGSKNAYRNGLKGNKSALGRSDNLDIRLYAKGKFESTPHGYFHKAINTRPCSTVDGKHLSSITFDHYNVQGVNDLIDFRRKMPITRSILRPF